MSLKGNKSRYNTDGGTGRVCISKILYHVGGSRIKQCCKIILEIRVQFLSN